MKNIVSIVIVILFVVGCKIQKNPLQSNSISTIDPDSFTWKSLNFPENYSKYASTIAVNSNKDIFIGAGGGRIFRFHSEDSMWSEQEIIWDKYITFNMVDSKDNILIGYCHTYPFVGSGVKISEDNGENWTDFYKTNDECKCITFLNDIIYVAGGHSVALTADYGISWLHIDDSLEAYNSIEGIAIDPVSHNIFLSSGGTGIICSKDHGSSWQWNGLDYRNVYPLLSLNNGYIFAGTSTGLYRTVDHGNSWMKMQKGVGDVNVMCMAKNSEDYLLVGTSKHGVFISIDRGDEWYNIGLEGVWIRDIAIDDEGYVYVTTDSIGVMKSKNSTFFSN